MIHQASPKGLTKAQQRALRTIRARIDAEHADFQGSDYVKQPLSDYNVRNYLETWVFPLLDAMGAPRMPKR